MATAKHSTVPTLDFAKEVSELKQLAQTEGDRSSLANEIVAIIDRHLKPLSDEDKQRARTARLIGQFTHALKNRKIKKRPHSRVGTMRSLEAFITKDVKTALKEYASFEATAEKALTENPAMHLTSRGVAHHAERALDIITRFTKVLAEQNEHVARFRSKLGELEEIYFDHDDWTLHLHDRINRLTNFLSACDAATTSLKRAITSDLPFEKALASLRALRDDSLNPLEFIDAVFGGHDHPANINVALPDPRLHYANHFLVREIFMELMHNAIASHASRISLKLHEKTRNTATLELLDNCPGGIPSKYTGWGLTTVRNTLVPRLGPSASITFESPLTSDGGTRVLVTVPVIERTSILAQAGAQKTRRRGLIPVCAFRSMDPFAVGGTALVRNSIITSITLP